MAVFQNSTVFFYLCILLLWDEWIQVGSSVVLSSTIPDFHQEKQEPPSSCTSTANHDATVSNALKFIDGYTDETYAKMRDDTSRTEAYRRAIHAHARGKVVLDIGTGALALLAIMAAEAGASKVYALHKFS
jgi:dihydropteroate synthase